MGGVPEYILGNGNEENGRGNMQPPERGGYHPETAASPVS